MSTNWNKLWYGFFSEPENTDKTILPDINDYIDESWEIDDIAEVLDYLKNSSNIMQSLSLPTKCMLCDEYEGDPGSFYFDGVWLWPERLVHYVENHNLEIPDTLLLHIRNRNYKSVHIDTSDCYVLPWPKLD